MAPAPFKVEAAVGDVAGVVVVAVVAGGAAGVLDAGLEVVGGLGVGLVAAVDPEHPARTMVIRSNIAAGNSNHFFCFLLNNSLLSSLDYFCSTTFWIASGLGQLFSNPGVLLPIICGWLKHFLIITH